MSSQTGPGMAGLAGPTPTALLPELCMHELGKLCVSIEVSI